MQWVKERDLLIAQTTAFVQSVTGKTVHTEARIEPVPLDKIEKAERPIQMPRMIPVPQTDVREEIDSRIAAFRAHQQRFHKDRDEYFNSVLAKARAETNSKDSPL